MDVTIFIRTKNEEALLGRCLEAVFSQRTSRSFEVIILDSGSKDKTLAVAAAFPVQTLSIPSSLFTFSSTLNAGVVLAKGDLFISLSGHAVPCNDGWLEALVAALEESPNTVGAYSRHALWPGASAPEVAANQKTFGTSALLVTPEAFRKSVEAGDEPFEIARFSNTSSIMRRSYLQDSPFRTVPFAEDRFFAVEALLQGHSIAYAPQSAVYHSHLPDFRENISIARRATIARCTINCFSAGVLSLPVSRYIGSKGLFLARAKIPLVALWAAATICYTLMRTGRPNRLRELRWLVAAIGTTKGKLQGLAYCRNADLSQFTTEASPRAILEHLGVKRDERSVNSSDAKDEEKEGVGTLAPENALPHYDARLNPILEPLVAEIVASLSGIDTILLGGSYGRGEGVLVESGHQWLPANDLDLVVVRRSWSWFSRRILRRIARHATTLKHLDLIPISVDDLGREPLSMLRYDLLNGSFALYGHTPQHASLTSEAPFPLGEIRNLLINRMVTLLEGHPRVENGLTGPAKARQISKVIYATFDADQFEARNYRTRYKEKTIGDAPSSDIDSLKAWTVAAFQLTLPAEELTPQMLLDRWKAAKSALLRRIVESASRCDARTYQEMADTFPYWRGRSIRSSMAEAIVSGLKGRKMRRRVEIAIACHLSQYSDRSEWAVRAQTLVKDWYGS